MKKQKYLQDRRQFVKNSLVTISGLGALSFAGYTIFNIENLRSLNNLLRMGHCAPSVMQTLLKKGKIDAEQLVRYAGGFSGGIAGSDTECGCLTAPMMYLSSQAGFPITNSAKLDLIEKVQNYFGSFKKSNDSCICRSIKGNGIHNCFRTVYGFYKPYSESLKIQNSLEPVVKDSYLNLISEFETQQFHCAHTVLSLVSNYIKVSQEMYDASWIFIGGLAMMNQTCGALAAGVLALSAATAKAENSYLRVARMNYLLSKERNMEAMQDEVNRFNHSIQLSDDLGLWFRKEFGSTKCRDIWGYDFRNPNDCKSYINGRCSGHCRHIAETVALKVKTMV